MQQRPDTIICPGAATRRHVLTLGAVPVPPYLEPQDHDADAARKLMAAFNQPGASSPGSWSMWALVMDRGGGEWIRRRVVHDG